MDKKSIVYVILGLIFSLLLFYILYGRNIKKNYDDSSSLRQKGSDTFDESGPCLGDFAGRPEGLF